MDWNTDVVDYHSSNKAKITGETMKCHCGHDESEHNKKSESEAGFTTCKNLKCPCTGFWGNDEKT